MHAWATQTVVGTFVLGNDVLVTEEHTNTGFTQLPAGAEVGIIDTVPGSEAVRVHGAVHQQVFEGWIRTSPPGHHGSALSAIAIVLADMD